MADHFIRDIEADDLTKSFRAFAYQSGQQAGRPSRAAAKVEYTFAGTKIHEPDGLLGDVEMVLLHLRAFAGGGPAVEFLLQFFVGGLGFVRHKFPRGNFRPARFSSIL